MVLLLRSFVVQVYKVPTGSLEPTVQPIEYILVTQFNYGLHLPITNTLIMQTGKPKIGDIVVFQYPLNKKINYVKRVIGLPGHHIEYKNKQLTINGKLMPQKFLAETVDANSNKVEEKEENLMGVKHDIFIRKNISQEVDYDLVVPQGYYFMMGDNRDGSADSRFWGFVPEANLIGKGYIVLFSRDKVQNRFRWERIGVKL